MKKERWDNMPKPTLTSLEYLADLYNDFASLSLCVSVNLLNLKELNDQKMYEKKAKSSKQGQKSVLGHGNELYKNFLDKEVCKGVKYCDSGVWDIISRSLSGSGLLNLCNRFEALLVPQNQKTRLPKLPKGTMDFCPNEVLTRRVVISSIKDIFRQHGAVEIETPVFELKETLLGKYGEDQKLIFDLKDQGGEQLSLRYDLTVPFARFVAMNKMEKIKRFHIGKVYRRDEPQLARGRYREFYQCDLDCAGEYPKMVPDSEVIFILVRVLRLLKGGSFAVRINHRAILDAVLFHCGVEVSMHRTICSSIDKLDKVPWDKVKLEMTSEKGLPEYIADKIKEFIEINGNFKEVLGKLRDKNIKTLTKDDSHSNVLDDMELLWSYLESFGVKESEVMFDMSLARGLDYYTGVIFEAFLKDEDIGSVGAGGRYDGLIGMFSGKNVPSVGMSVGIERLFRTMPKQNSGDLTDVFVCSVGSHQMFFERMKLVGMLWSHGIRAEFLYNINANLRKQLDAATDKGVLLMVLVGDSELETDTVKIKRLSYNEEERLDDLTVKRSDLISTLKSLLSDNTKYDKLIKTLFNPNNLES
uniref:Histidine--tRNA ligase, cytoplasmic n=1 Tax=Theileria annulata TaxID=5874 RepID=A0A3B0MFA6_THEAN